MREERTEGRTQAMTAILDALSRAFDAITPFLLCGALAAIGTLCVLPRKGKRHGRR
jgi:hypothetical protein